LMVRSSSVLAFSWATEGRIHTGDAGICCQINISGRPSTGLIPSSSQSVGVTILKRLRTLRGFRSSTAFLKCLSNSLPELNFLASSKDLWNSAMHGGITLLLAVDLLYAWNLSWVNLSTPTLRIWPQIRSQYGHDLAFRHCSLIFLQICVRLRLSVFGRRRSFRKDRRSFSVSSTLAQSCSQSEYIHFP
jgi:hypothetical protein